MNIFLDQARKTYGERTVLDIKEMRIASGSLLGVIGQNGAGKSTLLNIIAGVEPCTSGKVFYRTEGNESPDFKKMTLVTQHPYLLRTTVEKNIAYPLKIRKWGDDKIRARQDALIKEFGLCPLRKQKAWKLSAGESQKTALARALSFDPEVLLLDEPTANIDPGTVREIEAILKKVNEEKKTTIVIITHNLAQAKRLCGEVAFLHDGKLLEMWAGRDILQTPRHPLTARFIAGELI